MRFIFQSFVLILSFGLVYLWQSSDLSVYTIPALGFFIFLYLITSFRRKSIDLPQNETIGIFALTTVIVLLIFTTGKLTSPLFFLMYFLAFGIAFIFEPLTVFVFVLATLGVFLPDILSDDLLGNAIKTGGLVLITPLAYFFGKEFRKREAEEARTRKAADKISQDVGEVLQEENGKLDEKDVKKLGDVLEETEELRDQR